MDFKTSMLALPDIEGSFSISERNLMTSNVYYEQLARHLPYNNNKSPLYPHFCKTVGIVFFICPISTYQIVLKAIYYCATLGTIIVEYRRNAVQYTYNMC